MPSSKQGRTWGSEKSPGFVRLHLVAIHQLQPVPSNDLMGRFQKALRSVGAAGSVAVRSRMITAIASTRFQTLSGLPVSLVGLHGKDDVLVDGPPWALERLGAGESPPGPVATEHGDWLLRSHDVVATEISVLKLLPKLLALTTDTSADPASSSVSIRAAAEGLLGALFRTKLQQIHGFFVGKDVGEFVDQMIKEAEEVLSDLKSHRDQGAESYPVWWAGWDEMAHTAQVHDVLFTESGRHVTAYPVAGEEPERLRRARSNSLEVRVRDFVAAQP